MLEKIEKLVLEAKKAANVIKSHTGIIRVVSHYDSDGIASASIFIKALIREGKQFHLTLLKQLSEEKIESLAKKKDKLVVFLDFGAGQMNFINKYMNNVIVVDHHQLQGTPKPEVIHVNPVVFDIGENISGSGVTYILARAINQENRDLAELAVIGAIGDSQIGSIGSQWGLMGLNKEMLKDASETNKIKVYKGLRLWGRMTRSIHKALEYSVDPYIPGVSGSESGAVQFLQELGITLKKNGDEWRTLSDLSEEEQKKLASGIIIERIKTNQDNPDWIFGDVYELLDKEGEFKDANELSTMLNACVDPKTEIYLNGIPIPIKELNVNDLSNQEKFSINNDLQIEKDYIRKVHKVKLPEGIKVLELTSKTNKKIKLTENHEIMTIKNGNICWISAGNLKPRDFIAIPKKLHIKGLNLGFKDFIKTEEINNEYSKIKYLKKIKIPSFNSDVCTLIGYIVGDGHIKKYTINIAFKNDKEGKKNFKIISNVFKKYFNVNNYTIDKRDRCFVATWNGKILVELFTKIGIPIGKKSHIVSLNPKLLLLNEKNICGLLRGLFSSDGSFYKSCIEFATHSIKLSKQIQYLLSRVGIVSSLGENYCKVCKDQKYRVFIYGINNIKLFLEKIGFLSETKNRKIERILKLSSIKNSNTDLLPVNKILITLANFLTIPRKWSTHFICYKKGKLPTRRNTELFLDYFKNMINSAEKALNSRDIRQFIKELKVSKRKFAKEIGMSRIWLSIILKGKKPGKEAKNKIKNGLLKYKIEIKKIKSVLNHLDKICNAEIYWDRIKSIEVVKNPPNYVFDIKSTKNHNYIANGLIVHNCGKMGKAYLGVALCLNDSNSFQKVKKILEEYRRALGSGMNMIYSNKDSMVKETTNAIYILTGDKISEHIVSNVTSIISKSWNPNKPMFALGDSEEGIKISARANEKLDLNLKEILSDAAAHFGGEGGGHQFASGATIPAGNEEKFINMVENMLIKLKGSESHSKEVIEPQKPTETATQTNINTKELIKRYEETKPGSINEEGRKEESREVREESGEETNREVSSGKKVERKGLVQYFSS